MSTAPQNCLKFEKKQTLPAKIPCLREQRGYALHLAGRTQRWIAERTGALDSRPIVTGAGLLPVSEVSAKNHVLNQKWVRKGFVNSGEATPCDKGSDTSSRKIPNPKTCITPTH